MQKALTDLGAGWAGPSLGMRGMRSSSSGTFAFVKSPLSDQLPSIGWQDNTFGIGYLDAGHGHDFGLSEVALTNAAGNTRTSLESIRLGGVADAGTAGANNNVFPADPAADFSGHLAMLAFFSSCFKGL